MVNSVQVYCIKPPSETVKLFQKGGEQMDIHKKLRHLLKERGWTEYRLSKECNLSESTIANIFRRNATPSFSTLESICKGFGISLSQFFAEQEMVELTPELKELFDGWAPLTTEQKKTVLQMEKAFSQNSK